MDNKYIAALIRKFFENRLPEEIQQKFRYWFVTSDQVSQKREVMSELWEQSPEREDETTQQALKEIHKRIAAHEKKRSLSIYRYIGRIAAILLLPLLSAALTYYVVKEKNVTKEVELVECFVPYGERKQLTLSDGSKVWVNSGSLLIYAKAFEGKTRTIYLNGEANFDVAKDPEKPFIVKTESMAIEALGTVFNVLSYHEDEKSFATLESGRVRIITHQDTPQSIVLSPNEQLVYDKTTKAFEKKKIDAEKYARWKEGFLVFQSSSFENIIKTIERRFGVTVNYEANRFAGRTFTIRFLPEEDIREVMRILKDIAGVNYRIKENVIYIN